MITVNIQFDASDFVNKTRKMSEQMLVALDIITANHATTVGQEMKKSLLSIKTTSSKQDIAKSIKSMKIKRFNYDVVISQKGSWLDSMTPHYVSLKRGRVIVKWVKKYFGTLNVSNKSKVNFGPKGGVKGQLYVTPHPFIDRGIVRAQQKFNAMARRTIKNIVTG